MTILAALEQATREIGESYFLLPIANRDRPIKRERVYCYELFHLIRPEFHRHSVAALRIAPFELYR